MFGKFLNTPLESATVLQNNLWSTWFNFEKFNWKYCKHFQIPLVIMSQQKRNWVGCIFSFTLPGYIFSFTLPGYIFLFTLPGYIFSFTLPGYIFSFTLPGCIFSFTLPGYIFSFLESTYFMLNNIFRERINATDE